MLHAGNVWHLLSSRCFLGHSLHIGWRYTDVRALMKSAPAKRMERQGVWTEGVKHAAATYCFAHCFPAVFFCLKSVSFGRQHTVLCGLGKMTCLPKTPNAWDVLQEGRQTAVFELTVLKMHRTVVVFHHTTGLLFLLVKFCSVLSRLWHPCFLSPRK